MGCRLINGHVVGRPALRLALLLSLVLVLALPGTPALADPGDIGHQDQSFAGTSTPSTPTGTKRSESLLWFNDGHWWADMWDTVSQDYHIFKLDPPTQTWQDTGTALDPRITSQADVLWDGTHLYVATHLTVADEAPSAIGGDSRLYRYSYNSSTDTYSLDAGFPSQINTMRTETLVIDKDSTGKVWATWQQGNTIYVNSTQGNDQTWGVPFALPVDLAGSLTVDDNSSIVAFGGNKIGVIWSNQSDPNDGVYYAVHNDGNPDSQWQPTTPVISGGLVADDHLSLKALSDGRVVAATKTSNTAFGLPLTMLHVRNSATGAWSNHPVTLASMCPNRPVVLVDEVNDTVRVLETGPAPPDFSCNTTGGAIYKKTSSLSSISFDGSSRGQPVMLDADSPAMHNVTSTKQGISPATGLAALAINAATKFYWHHYETLPLPPPPGDRPVADFTASPTSGNAPLAVSFTDTSTGDPTRWTWRFGDGTSSTDRNPSHTYTGAGNYTVQLTATNANGSTSKTATINVRDFSLTASPAEGRIRGGQSTSYTVNVGSLNGWSGTVNLSVTGLPSGASASLNPGSVTNSGSATLTVTTSRNITRGSYTLTVRGTSGVRVKTTTVRLRVQKAK